MRGNTRLENNQYTSSGGNHYGDHWQALGWLGFWMMIISCLKGAYNHGKSKGTRVPPQCHRPQEIRPY